MLDRNNIVSQIIDCLGDGGNREIAERVFDAMRNRGQIEWSHTEGLVLCDDADVIAAAAALEG